MSWEIDEYLFYVADFDEMMEQVLLLYNAMKNDVMTNVEDIFFAADVKIYFQRVVFSCISDKIQLIFWKSWIKMSKLSWMNSWHYTDTSRRKDSSIKQSLNYSFEKQISFLLMVFE